jgi:Uma2 family endonuclease
MPRVPNVPFFDLVPDWICEVVSPSTAREDRVRKMRIYAREGLLNLWLVDPLARTLEVYGLESGRWVVRASHAGDATVRVEPFEAVALELSRWWIET